MKQGRTYLNIVVVVIAVAVVLYFGLSILHTSNDGYTTYRAVVYEVGDGITTSGFVVRDETVITSGENIVVLSRREGERVGANQTVAYSYTTREAQEIQLEIDELESRLAQLQYAYSYSGADAEAANLDAEIVSTMNQTAVYVNRRSLDFASGSADQLKSYVLRRFVSAENADGIWDQIVQTKARLEELYEKNQTASSQITTPVSGYFSGVVDGYEGVLNSTMLGAMTVEKFDQIPNQAAKVTAQQIGKLVTGTLWYYVTVVNTEDVTSCEAGDVYPVHFAYDFYDDVEMTVIRMGEDENGKRVLVLGASKFIQNTVSLREQSADIVFGVKQGLRIPKEAIHVIDGVNGVYVLEGAEAEWKPVTPLYYTGESIIVRLDQSSTDNLWPEDEVIITNDEIYDGKVMWQ